MFRTIEEQANSQSSCPLGNIRVFSVTVLPNLTEGKCEETLSIFLYVTVKHWGATYLVKNIGSLIRNTQLLLGAVVDYAYFFNIIKVFITVNALKKQFARMN